MMIVTMSSLKAQAARMGDARAHLLTALQGSLSPEESQRRQCEDYLESAVAHPGMVRWMMEG